MDAKRAAEILRVMMLDGDNYREDSQAAEMGANALEAWEWVEKRQALVSWQHGRWLCAVSLDLYTKNPTPLAAVLDAMSKEGKG